MRHFVALAAACCGVIPLVAMAETTGTAGAGQAISTIQPSLGITYGIRTSGFFPPGTGTPQGALGEISMFAGNFVPDGYLPADGRLLPIAQNTALFSLLGTTYGGNGSSNFALPNLQGRTAIGAGQGAGLSLRSVGETLGSESVTLSVNNLPAHSHTAAVGPGTAVSSTVGGGQPYAKMQPSLAVNYYITEFGVFPTWGGGSGYAGPDPVMGFVHASASPYVPETWTPANGQLMSITQNTALFSIIGTTYGGNGVTTFALPDLRGRAPIGVGADHLLGQMSGSETVTLMQSQMAAHDHSVVSLGSSTSITGAGSLIGNEQPSLGLHYIVATQGIFPTRDGGSGTVDEPLIGQISLFAGVFAPNGWAFCDGQLMTISQNTALFSILGTQYGGNGTTTFALPNLDDTLAVGAGLGDGLSLWDVGQTGGVDAFAMTEAQLPVHTHDVSVPEPSSVALCVLGLGIVASRRRDGHGR